MAQLIVADLMTPDPLSVTPDDDLAHVYDLMDDHKIRHMPVVSGDELVGMVTHRDLVARSIGGLDNLPMSQLRDYMATQKVRGIMVRGIETADPDEDVADAASRMFENKFGCLPVVVGSRLIGILTEADFVRHVAQREN